MRVMGAAMIDGWVGGWMDGCMDVTKSIATVDTSVRARLERDKIVLEEKK